MIEAATVGVDPGLSGAIAVVDGPRVRVYDIPTLLVTVGRKERRRLDDLALLAIAREVATVYEPRIVALELVGGMTGQSASASFSFGDVCGAIRMAFRAAGLRVDMVPPAVWKKRMGLGASKDDARRKAMGLWPDDAHLFARVKDDGRAEGALLAHYAQSL